MNTLILLLLVVVINITVINAFDSTEIRLMGWPVEEARPYPLKRQAPSLPMPLARFRKSSQMARGLDAMNPLIRFGKRATPNLSPLVRFGKRSSPSPSDQFWLNSNDDRVWLVNRF